MRVIYLHQYFNTPAMSGGNRSYQLARRLVARGHEVHVITSERSGRGVGWRRTEEAGVQVHWVPVAYSNGMGVARRLLAFGAFIGPAVKKGRELGGDVVFATSTPLTIAIPAVRIARQLDVPFVFEVRDLWPEVPIALGVLRDPLSIWAARRLERWAYTSAARVVVVSPGMTDAVVRQGVAAQQVTVIPNGCDFELFSSAEQRGAELRSRVAWLGNRPLAMYVGTIGKVNNVDYLVRLAAATAPVDPDIRFVIIGDGREGTAVRRLASDLGVLDRTLFMPGRVPKEEVVAWLGAATLNVTLIGPVRETWVHAVNNKFFDALAAGRPVLCNHGGFQTDVAVHHGCGIELPRHDFVAATRQLVHAIRDDAWLSRAGAAARELGRRSFDREDQAACLERVLTAAVERANGAVPCLAMPPLGPVGGVQDAHRGTHR
jgi:glycosyltransferase involved in cell wall biosynthesis